MGFKKTLIIVVVVMLGLMGVIQFIASKPFCQEFIREQMNKGSLLDPELKIMVGEYNHVLREAPFYKTQPQDKQMEWLVEIHRREGLILEYVIRHHLY